MDLSGFVFLLFVFPPLPASRGNFPLKLSSVWLMNVRKEAADQLRFTTDLGPQREEEELINWLPPAAALVIKALALARVRQTIVRKNCDRGPRRKKARQQPLW